MEITIDAEVLAALTARKTHPRQGLNAVIRRVLREHLTRGTRTDITPNEGESHARRSLRPRQHRR